MMSLADVRSYARTYFDLDAEDVPDTLLDQWVLDGFRRIIRSSRQWPHLETTADLAVVAGTASYARPLESIVAISFNGRMLQWVPEVDMARQLAGGTSSSDPSYYTLWAGALQFWPTPKSGGTAKVYGERAPLTTWLSTVSNAIDLPDDYQAVLLSWVLCELSKHQSDFTAAGAFASDFQTKLDEINGAVIAGPAHQPMILNGGSPIRWRYPYVFDVDVSGLH